MAFRSSSEEDAMGSSEPPRGIVRDGDGKRGWWLVISGASVSMITR
jgi:hypothetical protein